MAKVLLNHPTPLRRKRPPILCLMAVAIVLAFAATHPAREAPDSRTYLAAARNWAMGKGLAEQNGSPLAARLPAYPLLLGLVFRFIADDPLAISIVQSVLHVAAILILRGFLLRIGAKRLAVDLVSTFALVYPPMMTSTVVVLQETLLSLLLALVFVTSFLAIETRKDFRTLVSGLALGSAALAKSTALPLLVPLILALWLKRPRRLRPPVLAVAGLSIMLAPWAIRTQMLLGRWGVLNANGGHALLGGTVSNTIDDWHGFQEYVEAKETWAKEAYRRFPSLDCYLYSIGFQRIANDPLRWTRLSIARVFRFMLPARVWFVITGRSKTGTFGWWYVLAMVGQAALFLSAVDLTWSVARGRVPWSWLAGPMIVFVQVAVYAATYSSSRYNVTIGPILFALLAMSIEARQRGGVMSNRPTNHYAAAAASR